MTEGAPDSRVPAAWEWPRLVLLVANLFWTVLCLGGYRPETLLVTFPLTLALVAAHLALPSGGRRVHPILWLSLPFFLYAVANVAWVSPVTWLGWRDVVTWLQPLVVAWVVLTGIRSSGGRRYLLGAVALLVVVSAGLAIYQASVDPTWLVMHRVRRQQYEGRVSGPFGAPNSQAGLMILCFPILAATAFAKAEGFGRRALFGVAALAALVATYLTISRGAWLCLAGSLILWALVFHGGSVGKRLALAGGAFLAVLALFTLAIVASPTVRERFGYMVRDLGERSRPILWKAALNLHHDHPWLGTGAGSFNLAFEKYRPEGFGDVPRWAHNEYLNTLSDYGLVGVVLLAIPLLAAARRIWRLRGIDAALAVGLFAFGVHLFVEFHLKIPGLGIAFGLIGGLALASAWPAAEGGSKRIPMVRFLAAAAALALIPLVYPRLEAESLRYIARERIDRWSGDPKGLSPHAVELGEVRRDLEEAVRKEPRNGQAWSDLSYADSLEWELHPSEAVHWGPAAEAAARQAVKASPIDPECWERLCIGLDIQKRWAEGGDASVRALSLGPNRAEGWYIQAYHLAHGPYAQDEAAAAVEVALRLDPSYGPAQSLRQRLASSPPPASP